MVKWIIVILILALVLGISFIVAYKLSNIVLKPKKINIEDSLKREFQDKTITKEEYENIKKEDFEMINSDENKIYGEYLYCGKDTKKIIIICHGFLWNRTCSYKYALLFLKRGYDVLIYDHSGSGESEGKYTTMGYIESRDLKKVIDKVFEKYGKDAEVATLGESMGAATVLLNMAKESRLKFVIADCPYYSVWEQLAYSLKNQYHLPKFQFLYSASFITKLRGGFYFKEISPLKEIENSKCCKDTPLLLVHGLADTFIPCEASKKIKEAKGENVMLYLCKGAEHAKSLVTDVNTYDKVIDEFLDKYINIKCINNK